MEKNAFKLDDIEPTKTGTTTVTVICKNGVIMAADRQATAGYIGSRFEKKVHPVNENIALTIAGLVGDLQFLVRLMRSEIKLYELRKGPMTVDAAATLLSNILHSNRYFPYWVQLLIGGVDKKNGPDAYSLDAAGGKSGGEKIMATGSGSPIALGVLESQFKEEMKTEEAMPLVKKALESAKERDPYTGGSGFDIAVITEKGIKLSEIK